MKLLEKFRVSDLMLIALLAVLGIGTKPLTEPLVQMVTGPLFLPGGALAGGFHMFWLVLAAGLVGKRGTATQTAFLQTLLVVVSGSFGSNVLMSIVTYTLPGLVIDGIFLIIGRKWTTLFDFFLAGILANLAGNFLPDLLFLKLPFLTQMMSLFMAILSGSMGGVIAYQIYAGIDRLRGGRVN